MKDTTSRFYNSLADYYHLIFNDWTASNLSSKAIKRAKREAKKGVWESSYYSTKYRAVTRDEFSNIVYCNQLDLQPGEE